MNAELVGADLRPDLFARLDEVATTDQDYGWQLSILGNLREEARKNPDMVPALLDYAARPGGSLLVRSYALDIGVGTSMSAVRSFQAGTGQPPSAEQLEVYEHFRSVIPEHFSSGESLNHVPFGTQKLGKEYFWFFEGLAMSEHIDPRLVTPDGHDLGYDPTTVPTNVPSVASILLRRLIGGTSAPDINYLSPAVAHDALELALDFRSDAYKQAVVEDKYNDAAEFAQLWRLTKAGGFEHDAPIDFLYELPEQQGLEYARTFNRLYDAQSKLADFFPGINVVDGARSMIANALFAVEHHVKNGMNTDGSLQLRQAGELKVSFSGNEPIELLNKLVDKLDAAHSRLTSQSVVAEPVVQEANFTIFAFKDPANDPLQVALYIRERGGHTCNYRYEYGGRRPGVRASIDYRIDQDVDPARPYHKVSRTKEALSIRVDRDVEPSNDREVFVDPNKEEGVVSLDVGSLLGVGFGRDIALLLAFGNQLRSGVVGVEPGFNHQTGKIDQNSGLATVFAEHASALKNKLLGMRRYWAAPLVRAEVDLSTGVTLDAKS